jgi:unsaturated chondroitin disaccharide hydrolase
VISTIPTNESIPDRAFAAAEAKLRRLVTDHPGRVPVFTQGGHWHLGDDAWAPKWTAGFLAGMLWIVAQRTGDPWWRQQAERYSRDLAPRRFDTGTHDLGFLFTPSYGRWRGFDDTDEVRAVLVDAGRTMAGRFNRVGRYLPTWVDEGSTFIDVMMNLDIIYEAAEISGDKALAGIATAHARTSRRHLVRGDATVIHEGWFDPATGAFLRADTHQGWRSDSSWVRGHAWAIYGFARAFVRTRDPHFLTTARLLADSYIERSGAGLPPNDWEEAAPAAAVESSAACIAAAGLVELAEACGAEGARFRDAAILTVELLSSSDYLASADDGWDGLVKHATYHLDNDLGVDESVMWGDHYYLEAVHRLFPSRAARPEATDPSASSRSQDVG